MAGGVQRIRTPGTLFAFSCFRKQAPSSRSADTTEMADGARFELAEDISAFPRLAGEYLKPLGHPSNKPFDKSGGD